MEYKLIIENFEKLSEVVSGLLANYSVPRYSKHKIQKLLKNQRNYYIININYIGAKK